MPVFISGSVAHHFPDSLHPSLPPSLSPLVQMELHQKVVQQYSEQCGGAFATLSPDNYVHQMLLSHIAAAGQGIVVYTDK